MAETESSAFRRLADWTSRLIASPRAFAATIALIALWALSGFLIGFTNTWQLVINTFTNVVTLFIVFLIQNAQNRNDKAMQLKLDELIRAVQEARTHFVGLENLSDKDLKRLEEQFRRIQREQRPKIDDEAA